MTADSHKGFEAADLNGKGVVRGSLSTRQSTTLILVARRVRRVDTSELRPLGHCTKVRYRSLETSAILALADDQKTIRTGTAVMQKELRPGFCVLLMVHRLRVAGNRIFRNARNAMTSVRIGSAVALVFVLLACAAAPAVAQQGPDTLHAEKDEPLPEKVNDPTASLTQIQMKDIYTPAEYGTNAQPNTVQFRSVLTIRPYSLIPVEQLIRPTLKVVTLPNGKGSSTTNVYDDMQLFDLFVIPWPNSRETLFRWGFGPYFIFPTSTSNRAGNGAWQIGPAAGFSFRQIPGLNIAGLLQQATSFRYTTSPFCARLDSHNSADSQLSAGTRLVREIQRCHMDDQLAPPHIDDNPVERRIRQSVEIVRWILGRHLAVRRMDGLSSVLDSDRAVHYELSGHPVVPQIRVLSAEPGGALDLLRCSSRSRGLPAAVQASVSVRGRKIRFGGRAG